MVKHACPKELLTKKSLFYHLHENMLSKPNLVNTLQGVFSGIVKNVHVVAIQLVHPLKLEFENKLKELHSVIKTQATLTWISELSSCRGLHNLLHKPQTTILSNSESQTELTIDIHLARCIRKISSPIILAEKQAHLNFFHF